MTIHQNFPLKSLNSFGIEAYAKLFAAFDSQDSLLELLHHPSFSHWNRLVLGGGSNLLLTKDVDAFVLKNEWKGMEIVQENDLHVWVKAGGGVVWHELVMFAVNAGYGGIENLALIPGTVGASPIQNIGAYGVELKDVFENLQAMHLDQKEMKTFQKAECAFGYRDSIFKQSEKGKWIITTVTLKLSKQPVYNISYGAIEQELEHLGVKELSPGAIAQAVMNIRRSKLPDPKQIGNAGSFFKNPEVGSEKYQELKNEFPALVAYPVESGYKLAAGWLIEQCGWKGYRQGDAGCHEKQALVLVNYGSATGNELLDLSNQIIHSVETRFGVRLEREVNVV